MNPLTLRVRLIQPMQVASPLIAKLANSKVRPLQPNSVLSQRRILLIAYILNINLLLSNGKPRSQLTHTEVLRSATSIDTNLSSAAKSCRYYVYSLIFKLANNNIPKTW